MKKALFSILFIINLTACSTLKNQEKHEEIVRLTQENKLDEAIAGIEGDSFYDDDKSALLRRLELGNLHYLKGNYYQALTAFDQAKAIADDLYTTRISGKLATAAGGDNADFYYGSKYEVSMIRFYSSLCHYHLYKQGFYEAYVLKDKASKTTTDVPKKELSSDEKRMHLQGARAVILEWATYLKSVKDENLGEATYKDDLLNKVYGAFIHEFNDTAEERNTARLLYKEALDVLFKNYNIYPTYNDRSDKFASDFSKLPNLPKQAVESEYVTPTEAYKTLEEFLKAQVKRMEEKKTDNVKLVVKDALVSNKKVMTFKVPVPRETISSTGSFVALITAGSQFTFEYPSFSPSPPARPYTAKFEKSGKDDVTATLVVINPLSDIAYRAFKENEAAIKAKVTARSLAKYTAAVIAAYAIYQSDDSLLAKVLAIAAYHTSLAVIRESERADVRNWATLAGNVRVSSLKLDPGEYRMTISDSDGKTLHSQNVKVEKSNLLLDVNLIEKAAGMPGASDATTATSAVQAAASEAAP